MLIGYHYTTKNAWEEIQKEGLKGYRKHNIEPRECSTFFKKRKIKPKGVWLWFSDPGEDNEDELGIVIARMCTKNTLQIVKLEVSYELKETYKFGEDISYVTVDHRGENGNWLYHKNREAIFIIGSIPPNRIKKVKEFNLYDMYNN
ncbi:MAG: hypothetical protein ACOCQR_03390 [bacterium]